MTHKKIKFSDLRDYKYNFYSQNGEDGVIQEINKRLDLDNKSDLRWCVEFGAWDGIFLSNTFKLVKEGWNCIYIEGDKEKYKDLEKTKINYPKIVSINKFISKERKSPNSLDNILSKTKIPKDFEILSIDIDSFDLEVWESFTLYMPKIVIIEINSAYPPGIIKWHSNNYKNSNGNSFSATLSVADKKGYKLVCHTGNMIFIREDLIDEIGLEEKYINFPEILYDDLWYSLEKQHTLFKIFRKLNAFLKVKIIGKLKKYLLKKIIFKNYFFCD